VEEGQHHGEQDRPEGEQAEDSQGGGDEAIGDEAMRGPVSDLGADEAHPSQMGPLPRGAYSLAASTRAWA